MEFLDKVKQKAGNVLNDALKNPYAKEVGKIWNKVPKGGQKAIKSAGKHILLPLILYDAYETLNDPNTNALQKANGLASIASPQYWLADLTLGNAYNLAHNKSYGQGWDILANVLGSSIIDTYVDKGYISNKWGGFYDPLIGFDPLVQIGQLVTGKEPAIVRNFKKERQALKEDWSDNSQKLDQPYNYFSDGQISPQYMYQQQYSNPQSDYVDYSQYVDHNMPQYNYQSEQQYQQQDQQQELKEAKNRYYDNMLIRSGYRSTPNYYTIPQIGRRLT